MDVGKHTGLPKNSSDVRICAARGSTFLYRPPKKQNGQEPCSDCGGTGYRGRTGVFELLGINDRLRDMIREKSGLRDLKHEARKAGIEYLQEYGIKLVVQGRTSIQELLRVVK